MSPRHTGMIFAVALCQMAPSAHADEPKPPIQTLAQALALAAPKSELYIAVDADKVTLPKDAAPAEAGATAARVATVFGRKVGGFGNVDAIAPATITVVNAPPDKINPYDGMEPKKLIKILTSEFDSEQWKALLSAGGLGYADLTSDRQRALFEELFPDHHLSLGRYGADEDQGPVKDVGGDALKPARLRLVFKTTMALHIPNTDECVFSNEYIPASRPTPYVMWNSPVGDVDREYGAVVRQTMENTLKPSDFGDSDAALRSEVSTAGIKTVDDAVRRISAAAGREIYADARYAKRTLTMVGTPRTVPAMDLLRALALCLGATYRQVGSAYVLTDDLVGLGAKHQLWKEFEDKATQRLAPGEREALRTFSDCPYTIRDIPWTDDVYPLTPKQQEENWPDSRDPRMDCDLIQINLPFADLSPAQQEAARRIQALNVKDHTDTTLAGNVILQAEPIFEIMLPSLDAPVLLFESYNGLLAYTPEEREEAHRRQTMDTGNLVELSLGPVDFSGAPPTTAVKRLEIFKRRAVRAAPKSVEEVTKDLDAMKSLGIGELWLSITPGSDEQDEASLALLHEAVPLAQTRNIAVYPDVSLFLWSDQEPETLLDRTITGAAALQEDASQDTHADDIHDTVSRFDPEVGRRLSALIGRASREPGVAGMVWENKISAGYERIDPNQSQATGLAPIGASRVTLDPTSIVSTPPTLGYTVAGRLANLRKNHVDPIDLHDNTYADKRAHVRVPEFDDDTSLESSLCAEWRRLCADWNLDLLRSLTGALPHEFAPGPHRLPLILLPMNRKSPALYGSWDDFSQPPSDEYSRYQETFTNRSSERYYMGSTSPYAIVSYDLMPNTASGTVDNHYSDGLKRLAELGERGVVFDAIRHPTLLKQLRDAEPEAQEKRK